MSLEKALIAWLNSDRWLEAWDEVGKELRALIRDELYKTKVLKDASEDE